MCTCKEAELFRTLQKIFSQEISWYKKHQDDEGFLYDESWTQFAELGRGECQEILKLLAENQC